MEFALTELWQQGHRQGRLTHEAYRALGGISGALAQWADGAYHELGQQQRLIARGVFLDLVHVADEGEQLPDTRQRKDPAGLCAAIGDRESVEAVVRQLATKRLLVSSQKDGHAVVELVHDALIREWGPLRSWIAEERPFRRWLQETAPALRTWGGYVHGGRQGDEPDWLRGRRLVQAEHWLGHRGTELPADLLKFIRESQRVRDEEAERERRQLVADEQRRQDLRVSESLRLASEAQQAIRAEPETALLVAWEAVLQNRNELTESVFRETLDRMPAPVKVPRWIDGCRDYSLGFLAQGALMFAASEETGDVGIWNPAGELLQPFVVGDVVRDFRSGTTLAVPVPHSIMLLTWRNHVPRLYQADGTVLDELPLAVGDPTQRVRGFGRVISLGVEDAAPQVTSLGLSVPRAGLGLVHHDGRAWMIEIDHQRKTLRLLRTLRFSSDDRQAAIHGGGASVHEVRMDDRTGALLTEGDDAAGLWAEDGTLRAVLPGTANARGGFIADGRVVTTTQGGVGDLWDSGGRLLSEFKAANGTEDRNRTRPKYLYLQAVTEAGDHFATTVYGSAVTEVWTADGELAATLDPQAPGRPDSRVCSAAFSADGNLLATGCGDGVVRVCDWRREVCLLELHGHRASVHRLAFHPMNPGILLSGSQNGGVRLWDLDTPVLPPLRGHDHKVNAMAATPAGLLSSDFRQTRVWRADGTSASLVGGLKDWHAEPGSAITVLTEELAPMGKSPGAPLVPRATVVSRVPSSGAPERLGAALVGPVNSFGFHQQTVLSPDGSCFLVIRESTAPPVLRHGRSAAGPGGLEPGRRARAHHRGWLPRRRPRVLRGGAKRAGVALAHRRLAHREVLRR